MRQATKRCCPPRFGAVNWAPPSSPTLKGEGAAIRSILDCRPMNEVSPQDKGHNPLIRNYDWVDPRGRVIAASHSAAVGTDMSDM